MNTEYEKFLEETADLTCVRAQEFSKGCHKVCLGGEMNEHMKMDCPEEVITETAQA